MFSPAIVSARFEILVRILEPICRLGFLAETSGGAEPALPTRSRLEVLRASAHTIS
jgi:hypothetical protein